MPIYHTLGKIPHKRHTAFKKADGSLYYEQLFGTEGFSGMSSLLYHMHRPTQVKEIGETLDIKPEIALDHNMKAYRFRGFEVKPKDDYLDSRTPVLVNRDCYIELAAPRESMKDYYYKNVDADEVIFIHEGEGTMHTLMGDLDFSYGDYLVVPRGMIYQMEFKASKNRLLIVQSFSPIYTPKRYRNNFGQLMEHSPFCERDIRRPEYLEPTDEKGEFLVKIKKEDKLYHFTYATHPFDVVGWDGFNYPYAFSIHDFEPITGRVHMPPPIHQTFEAAGFVICSFVPRMYDYHPQSIPAPYNHSNIDSDEVLYYVDGDFMSRNNIEKGNITIHPAGAVHGPHPGAAERSIGKKETEELAVMVDTFKPLKMTKQAMAIADEEYWKSWLE
ncbi:homogentisate 1,2-dioxygenase [Cryomorpha ignava]|uniref:Homogentisate 1,2-dioxygenase n=1 Tax=Cryomorpha ignava TaxID=101383 RepID=A0A7K3WQD0_9FLAO|nr:homogentisate 1,2-dioxygenase [Cryomorpha ignava]NEN23869.1 homogentisate 1,2-dioxygenase [Cryomorpha ignava]